jgi:hypothetical protein
VNKKIIHFFQELFFPIFDYALDKDALDIGRALQRKALQDTVDFINKTTLQDARTFKNRLSLIKFGLQNTRINGLYLEFGVWKGGAINFIASQTDNIIFGFDSFEGLPERWRGNFAKGHFAVEKLPSVRKNVILKKGWFADTLPKFLQEESDFCSFIHMDCNLYSSTKTVFDLLQSRIVKDTIIVFDEFFNYPGWQNGEFKAFMEYTEQNDINYEYLGYDRRRQEVVVRIL